MSYVGRFAPSPTGPLHIGSLATAVASFVHARQHDGQWLLRIDDLDPPRCVPGSASAIMRLLDRLELHWDGAVYHQRARWQAHHDAALRLLETARAYYCDCSRRRLREHAKPGPLGIPYDGKCRNRALGPDDAALRVRVNSDVVEFPDRLQGRQKLDLAAELGDYIVFRRDRLPAYHLAAVLDDADQGVTDVVRGCDLLAGSAVQVHLAQILGLAAVQYWHLPVLCNARGKKLSKQHGAAAVDERDPGAAAFAALGHIGAQPPGELAGARPAELWQWAVQNWQIQVLAARRRRIVL